jgi:hypothetical protein
MTRESLPTIFSAIFGIALGLGLTGAVLFTSIKVIQYFWDM